MTPTMPHSVVPKPAQDEYRQFQPSSQFIKFTQIGEVAEGILREPVPVEAPDGTERQRYQLELPDGKRKILPDNRYLTNMLEDVVAAYGVPCRVKIEFVATKPSKKGNPTKIYNVGARPLEAEKDEVPF